MGEPNLSVLVLAVGGNVSQGILKALAISNFTQKVRIVTACINPLSPGLFTADKAYISPRADDPNFLDWLIKVCRTEKISAILAGSEVVLAALAQNTSYIREESGAICLVSPPEVLAIGDDKLLTCEWLKSRGFNYPKFACSGDLEALAGLVALCGFPLIGKPRRGKGGSGVQIIRNSKELAFLAGQSGFLIQEYLGDVSTEYTVGGFSDRVGQLRGSIVLRRELVNGTTVRAEAGEFPEVRAEAARIAAALKPLGPCNIQLRVSEGQPVCFEINVRFSGTTPIRARFGFNEVEASIRHFVLGEPAFDLPHITRGVALRYWNEMYLDPEALVQLNQTNQLSNPGDYATLIENYGSR